MMNRSHYITKNENNLDKKELNQKESQNLFTTFFCKKSYQKKEVYPLNKATNTNEGKKENLLSLKNYNNYKSCINRLIDKNEIDMLSDIVY